MKKVYEKLTDAEAKRLEQAGKQQDLAHEFGVAASTLSRALNRHNGPSPLLRDKLIEKGIIKAKKEKK